MFFETNQYNSRQYELFCHLVVINDVQGVLRYTQPHNHYSIREFLLSAPHTDLSDLVRCNINTLSSAAALIKDLPKDKYNHVEAPYFESCLGKHMRHILDHYLCFSRDLALGVIDYDQRNRDVRLETDKEYTLSVIAQICDFLTELGTRSEGDVAVKVLLCNDVSLPQGEATDSSIRRELQFLQGHAVHHYALIATMLRFYGLNVDREFGIAPSTLVHEEAMEKDLATENVKVPA